MNKPAIGHVYVLELTGGLIKVGYSADVEFRVKRHASNVKKHGLAVVRHWVSPRHVEAGLNEEALIASCEMGGGVHFRPGEGSGLRRGREWFRGVEFDSVVARAASLNFTPCGDGEIGTTLEMARRSLGEIVNRAWLIGERTTITKQGKPAAVVVSAEWYEQVLVEIGETPSTGSDADSPAKGEPTPDEWRLAFEALAGIVQDEYAGTLVHITETWGSTGADGVEAVRIAAEFTAKTGG